jgi:hypothetical protein
MKSGLDNKRNVIVLVVLLAILAICVWYFVSKVFVGGPSPAPAPKTSSTAAAPATERAEVEQTNAEASAEARTGNENGRPAKKLVSLESLDPTLHPELMAGAESLVYSGNGRNIFSMSSAPVDIPKPVNNGRNETAQAAPPQPAGPPQPPPIDLTLFGVSTQGNARKAFILHGDDVFIAAEGEVVDHHYKVVKITPLSIEVTDLLYNHTQTLTLSQS